MAWTKDAVEGENNMDLCAQYENEKPLNKATIKGKRYELGSSSRAETTWRFKSDHKKERNKLRRPLREGTTDAWCVMSHGKNINQGGH